MSEHMRKGRRAGIIIMHGFSFFLRFFPFGSIISPSIGIIDGLGGLLQFRCAHWAQSLDQDLAF